MALTAADVIELAREARLQITPEEIERFRVQLSDVLDRINELSDVEPANLETAPEQGTALRNDEVAPDAPIRDATELSEHVVSRFFTVPRALPSEGAQ